MRILLLTPGTGSYFCGNCLRDNALAGALRGLGADAVLAPLYLPFVLEDDGTAAVPARAVHMGGINVYLQQRWPWTRHLPRWLHDALDRPRLLRWVSARADMTDAHGLGEMTLSMLSGEQGRQAAELERLVHWLASEERPDVVLLSNVMLVGLARRIRAVAGVPVLCTIQGEAPFLDALPEPHRSACWSMLAERAADVDLFLPVSRFAAELMGERMGVPADRLRVVPNGIDAAAFAPPADTARPSARPPTLGYLARMCADKGLPTLVEAFLLLRERFGDLRLVVGGVQLAEDRALVRRLEARLSSAGAGAAASFRPNLSAADKLALLHELTVFSVPATYGESFGLYLLEALAAGVPVVQPEHAAFPEILEATGGGLLCTPDDPAALAEAIGALLADPARARALGEAGRRAVASAYTTERMGRAVLEICTMAAD